MNFRIKYDFLKSKEGSYTDAELKWIKEIEEKFKSVEIGPLKFQVLNLDTYYKRFQDFSKCEDSWGEFEISVEKFQQLLDLDKRTREQLGQAYDKLEWSYVKEQLIEGRVVRLVGALYRMNNDLKKCPICGGNFEDYEACSSRRDNETKVCGYCGESEAMDDFFGVRR